MKTAPMPRVSVLALLLAVLACGPAAAEGWFAWELSPVDPDPQSGVSLAFRVEPGAVAHVAFWTIGVGVRYGVRDGAAWSLETLPDAGVPPGAAADAGAPRPPDETDLIQHTSVALAVAPDGAPWIGEIDHGRISHSDVGPIAVRHREGGLWVTEWIGDSGDPVALEIDAAGTVHAAWHGPGGIVQIARRTGPGAWTTESAVPSLGGPALALGADGAIHLAVTGSDGIVHHAVRAPGGAWIVTPVAGPVVPGHTIGAADLDLDPAGRPAIVTLERDPLDPRTHLRLHRFDGAGWSHEDVDVDPTTKLGGLLAFDGAGNALVAYRREAESRFVVAMPGTPEWTWTAVDSVGTGNQGMDGGFDGLGRPWFVTATQSVGVRLARGQRTTDVEPPPPPDGPWLGAPAPVPARAGATLALAVRARVAGTMTFETVDARGAVRLRRTHAVGAGAGTVRLSTRGLAPGVYWIRARDAGGRVAARRLVLTG